MKVKVTNDWILNFNAVRGHLNLISKETGRPTYNLGPDATYAIARTGKKLKDEVELLQEFAEKVRKLRDELAKTEDEKQKEKLTTEIKVLDDEWKTLLDKEIEVEIHSFKVSDLPRDLAMPEGFYATLDTIMVNGEQK